MSGQTAKLRVGEATAQDIAQIARIEASAFTVPWTEAGFADVLCREDVLLIVVKSCLQSSEKVVGYICMYLSCDEGEITNVAVDAAYRGQGVGTAVMEYALERAAGLGIRRVFLEVRPSNSAALALYSRFGFVRTGERRGFYEKPREDAWILEWETDKR